MTNTSMCGGALSGEEIVSSIKRGVYATAFDNGEVDITNGNFVFFARESFWVENGRVLYPLKNVSIVGNGPEAMNRISMIGNDQALDLGTSTCSKEGQLIPVSVGQPTIRIDGLTVGGVV
jgi:TldD protein